MLGVLPKVLICVMQHSHIPRLPLTGPSTILSNGPFHCKIPKYYLDFYIPEQKGTNIIVCNKVASEL